MDLSSRNGRGPVCSTRPSANRFPMASRSQRRCLAASGPRCGVGLDFNADYPAIAEFNEYVHFMPAVRVADVKQIGRKLATVLAHVVEPQISGKACALEVKYRGLR
jgi:hypothetical protein